MILNLHVGQFATCHPDRGVTERGERVAFCRFHEAWQTWSDGSTTRWDASVLVRVECESSCQFLPPQDVLRLARSSDPSARLIGPDPFAPETPAAPPQPRPEQGALALSFADPSLPPVRRSR